MHVLSLTIFLLATSAHAINYPEVRVNTAITPTIVPYGAKAYEARPAIKQQTISSNTNIQYLNTQFLSTSDEFYIPLNNGQSVQGKVEDSGFYHKIRFRNDSGSIQEGYIYETNVRGDATLPNWENYQDQILSQLETREALGNQENCDPGTLQESASDMQTLLSHSENNSGFKSEEELDEYFRMFRKRDSHWRCPDSGNADNKHDDFLNTYKPILKKAAEIFDIPYAFLACKAFKESQFDHAVSNSGATGLMQFVQNGVDEVNNILNLSIGESYRNNLISQLRTEPNDSNKYKAASNVLNKMALQDKWQRFIEENGYEIDSDDYDFQKFTKNTAATSILRAIGAGALYLSHIDHLFKINNRSARGLDSSLYYAVVGGAYNQGYSAITTNLNANLSQEEMQDANNWYSSLTNKNSRFNLENDRHIRSLQACMEPGNFDGPIVTRRIALEQGESTPTSIPELRTLNRIGSYFDNNIIRFGANSNDRHVYITLHDEECD